MPTQEAFEIAGRQVEPGTRLCFELPVARLATQNMVQLPIAVLHGVRPGPRLFITAAVHGDELNGTEIARQLIQSVDPTILSGTLMVLPIVNVLGFIHGSRYLPDRRDLNRSFPGSGRGSLAAQLAHLVTTEIIRRSTHGLDLHGGSLHRSNLPQIRGNFENPGSHRLCLAFSAPISIHSSIRSGSLRGCAERSGIPVALYEAGEPLRLEETPIREGFDGVLRVMAHLGMISTAPTPTGPSLVSTESQWHRASRAGIARFLVELGDFVQPGTVVSEIGDAFGKRTAVVKSRVHGVVVGCAFNPIVGRGDALVHVAVV